MTPLISGESGEGLAFLTESQQTPSKQLDLCPTRSRRRSDEVKVIVAFLLQNPANAKEEEIARFLKNVSEMPAISNLH